MVGTLIQARCTCGHNADATYPELRSAGWYWCVAVKSWLCAKCEAATRDARSKL